MTVKGRTPTKPKGERRASQMNKANFGSKVGAKAEAVGSSSPPQKDSKATVESVMLEDTSRETAAAIV